MTQDSIGRSKCESSNRGCLDLVNEHFLTNCQSWTEIKRHQLILMLSACLIEAEESRLAMEREETKSRTEEKKKEVASKENWSEVGKILEKLCRAGLFPIVEYHQSATWKVCVFLPDPVKKIGARFARGSGDTAIEAVEDLLDDILSSGLVRKSVLNELRQEKI